MPNGKKDKNKAWNRFRRYFTPDNMIAFNKARARARKIHRQRKRESWIKYVQPQVKRFGTISTPCQPFKALSLYIRRLIPYLWTSLALANHLRRKISDFVGSQDMRNNGNELAGTAARSATGSSERFPIPHSDLKACFRQKL
ncbi:hypothetical protein TNCT_676561, partial [Trichonephila clavata]